LRPFQRSANQLQLLNNVDNDAFVKANLRFDRWAADQLPLPGELMREFVRDFLRANQLITGDFHVGDKGIDLGKIRLPFLHVAAEYDHIVPTAASSDLIGLIGSKDKQEIVVKDFTSYPSEFPFKDPSCLTRPGYSAAEIDKMHQEDLADEARITVEITAPAVTRSQSAQLASKQPLIQAPLQPPIIDLSPVLDLLPPPAEEPQQIFISSRDRVLDTPMVSLSELDLARSLLNSGYPVILPPSYAAFPQLKDLAPVTGPMVVVGYKVQKLCTSKTALWVRFISPCEYAGNTIQMYPKSLEPKKGPACGADFSLLRAISASNPQATTLRDLGINSSSSAALTSTLLRHFCSMQKPRDSVTAAFDDHGTCDDLDTELHIDFPVLPPQQSAFDGPPNLEEIETG
jgi:hypothetical protein